MVKLGSVAQIINGDRSGNYPSGDDFRNVGVPFINAGHLQNGKVDYSSMDYISREKYNQLSGAKIQRNDVLLCLRGSLGKYALVTTDGGAPASSIAVIRPNAEKIDSSYLSQIIASSIFQKQIEVENNGSSQPNLSAKSVSDFVIPLPSLEEQQKIASVLYDMDAMLDLLEKQISKKKAIKQGAMQELLTGKKRLPGFFGEWQSFVFGDLFDFIPNNAFTRAQMDVSGRVKNIHYGDILTKYGAYISADSKDIPYIAKEIDLSRFSEKCYLQSGDLVIADTAEDETVGKALEVINVECPVLAGQHTLLCRPKVRFAEKFLGYYLNAACYHDQLLPYIVGTKVSSVSKASIAQTKLVVPKYEEQQAISSILADMDDEITELEHKLAKYRQVKQGMMQQLLTGKIRLKNDVVDSVHTEQKASAKKSPVRSAHNHQFDDAVSIAAIVDAFYSDKYPLGRVKVQKLLYLLHRHQAVSVSDFKKKAAGFKHSCFSFMYCDDCNYREPERSCFHLYKYCCRFV